MVELSKQRDVAFSDTEKKELSSYPQLQKLKRRTFLGWLGKAAVAAVGTAVLPQEIWAQSSEDTDDRLRRLTGVPHHEAEEQETIVPYFDLKLIVDGEGFPKAYQIKDEPRIDLSQTQLQRLRQAQEQSLGLKEVEPGFQLFIPLENFSTQPSERSPFITEAPHDLLSKEQLSEIGVTIVNPTGDSLASKLLVRESARGEAGILEPLRLLNEGKSVDQQFKLDIVTLNAPFVAEEFFSKNPSYQKYKPVIDSQYGQMLGFKREKLEIFDQVIDQVQTALKTDPTNSELLAKLRLYKFARLAYGQTLTDRDMMIEMLGTSEDGRVSATYFFSESVKQKSNLGENQGIIFMCAPQMSDTLPSELYTLYFDENGALKIHNEYWDTLRHAHGPRITESYPEREDFRERPPEDAYKILHDRVGATLPHEIMHALTIDVFARLQSEGKLHQSSFFNFLQSKPAVAELLGKTAVMAHAEDAEIVEGVADEGALAYVDRADHLFEATGDDSGYSFVWKVPAQFGLPAGYQITQSQESHHVPENQAT